MGTIASAFAYAFRKYVTDGVPSSGLNNPSKTLIQQIGPVIEAAIAGSPLGEIQAAVTGLTLINPKTSNDPYVSNSRVPIAFPVEPYSFVSGRLLAGYSGYSVRVKRASDAEEVDFGWDASTKGVDLAAIRDWLALGNGGAGSSGTITRIYDQGTRGGYWIAYPGHSVVPPVNLDVVRDGVLPMIMDNSLYGYVAGGFTSLVPDSVLSLSRQSISAFEAAAFPSSLEGGAILTFLSANSPLTESFNLMTFGTLGTTANVGLYTTIDGSFTGPRVSAGLVPPIEPCVVGFTSSASAFKHWLDGRSNTLANLATGAIVGAGLSLTTLGDGLFGSFFHYGLAIFNTALSDADARAVDRTMSNIVRRPKDPIARIVVDGTSRETLAMTTALQTWSRGLEATLGRTIEIYNMSFAGKLASVSAADFATVIAPMYRPDIPCIYMNLLGVNDINNGASAATTWAAMQSALAAATALGFLTVAATAYPILSFTGGQTTALGTLNTSIRGGLGTDYLRLLDLAAWPAFQDMSNPFISPDGTHLTSLAQSSITGFAGGVIGSLIDLRQQERHGPHAIITDEKLANTAGGTFTSGADQTRTLNTLWPPAPNPSGISIASNRFMLPAGTWIVKWSAPAYKVGAHRSFLYDYTHSLEIKRGGVAAAGTADTTMTRSDGEVSVIVKDDTEFEIRHRATSTEASDGFGIASNFGIEIYTTVEITRAA
ncbi:hypothetical protein C3941_23785 [Kaistia algarum]|uniref:hypothetical protein n=1 Tax=Kaistia algarum TaxID=2083279 RepID=UPI000CE92202|nr:hypothetical protein [Kaistia algarum]MCX5513413.1 hypothetical protein [Kaistia algarum]PPE77420.1 hypothetical protein C3941_23785 [Kaistia algarum]